MTTITSKITKYKKKIMRALTPPRVRLMEGNSPNLIYYISIISTFTNERGTYFLPKREKKLKALI
jgi:hypothetical protein